MGSVDRTHWKELDKAFREGTDEEFLKAVRGSQQAIGAAGGKVAYIPSYYVWRLLGIAEARGGALDMVLGSDRWDD